ncbi:MAG: peptide chain release factor 2, peptide chain release factor RF-2 [Candidatus Moranbacteria bacterium GW2011_GWC1_45_18]|nr:MAG: Peptide chain release factor 2 [Candidatus Moranbacteria bacterium GW2011_GWC2_40_12]KKT33728.1 MAG: Peptide chain release factor 2 [Candidatus Moranbacteria bacterium GW2011_GWF2_44_10]KKT69776.1 MAG: Peptide chain release factor 2 [Candidatus Moranbacteria bacterium GW2011_GWF1_44_4]KKU00082.1 MAG: peptide chain release factor 2, peptide chain release factor RF-2 [Candidatus Moranbacteria bacterium GW2011_GWC1_45_18]OGI22283.1 MAG: peptide chain release factor 2 [Candidatus Moranbacte
MTVFDLLEKNKRIQELEKQTKRKNFWQDAETAKKIMQELETLRNESREANELEAEITNLWEMAQIAGDDDELKEEILKKLPEIKNKVEKIEIRKLFQGKYDRRNAILFIHSGTGGTDAQDWAEMLLRMYLRYAERKKWKAKIVSSTRGQEAGIKSATIEIDGISAYGHLKAEAGVHRLVRLSPFNSNNLRQTSFALVEILPEIDKIENVEINPADLRIDTFRAGGAGGQHVNKTSSAVRITHIPTGLSSSSQSERSQLQNREQAMKILKAKLNQKNLKEQEDKEKKLKGKHAEVQWGSQIRSYILHPYKLVKDHRTKFESKNPNEVLEGKIEDFIEAYLKNVND